MKAVKASTVIVFGVMLLGLRPAVAEPAPASFAYVLQADLLAKTKSSAVAQLKTCGRDWIVLDAVFSGGEPWTRADLETIRQGKAERKVIAYVSIGEAEDYRPYWVKEWNDRSAAGPPTWLGTENPDWPGNYRVNYWRAEWQKIILNAIDDVMACGFDGVYLDIVDGFETFEQDGQDFIDDRINPETRQTFRRDMVNWVKAIAAQTRAKHPNALVIPQNGSQLLAHGDFLSAISAIGIEDLFTNGNALQSTYHVDEVLGHLKTLDVSQKPILLIEYSQRAKLQALSKKMAQKNRMVWLITDRHLKTLGASGK